MNQKISISLDENIIKLIDAERGDIFSVLSISPLYKWAWPDLNRRPSLCESDVITARPQAPVM